VQSTPPSSFELVLQSTALAALYLGASVEQPFDWVIIQKRQAVQSMGRSMDWTWEDNMVDGLFFCATLSDRRVGHTIRRSGNGRQRCGGV